VSQTTSGSISETDRSVAPDYLLPIRRFEKHHGVLSDGSQRRRFCETWIPLRFAHAWPASDFHRMSP
jgi:hypothetical protein